VGSHQSRPEGENHLPQPAGLSSQVSGIIFVTEVLNKYILLKEKQGQVREEILPLYVKDAFT